MQRMTHWFMNVRGPICLPWKKSKLVSVAIHFVKIITCAWHALTIGKEHVQNLRSMFVRGVVLADEIMERFHKKDNVDDTVFWFEMSIWLYGGY